MVSATDILNAKILVVDDKPANVQLIERMLRGAGYSSIESTTDACAVCDLHRRNGYNLILLDLQMPGLDGFLESYRLLALRVEQLRRGRPSLLSKCVAKSDSKAGITARIISTITAFASV